MSDNVAVVAAGSGAGLLLHFLFINMCPVNILSIQGLDRGTEMDEMKSYFLLKHWPEMILCTGDFIRGPQFLDSHIVAPA